MITKTTETLAELYETDESAWLEAMAELIRDGRLSELDYHHLQEHLEDMALRDRKKVESRQAILIAHVLQWTYQPENRTASWRGTIIVQRYKLTKLLESGTLRKHAESSLVDSYADAVDMAMEETKLSAATFPPECPWTLEQLLAAEMLAD
ncbi:MAG: DUF29 domain-containing protein [Gemmataceae bacterium]|nr:DUF29 domain-containing protein [Gemmataceae bacterium]